MFLLSLAYRVIGLHAEESRHEVVLQEIRRAVATLGPTLANGLSGAVCGPSAPPSIITAPVTPDQFAGIRVGDIFELAPSTAPKCDAAVSAPFVSQGVTQVAPNWNTQR
jgi:hypothetical protein